MEKKGLALLLSIVVCVAAIALAPGLGESNAVKILWIEIAALGTLMIALGSSVTKHFWGILINERNLMSLTRFQAVLWTVIVLADFATVLLIRAWKNLPVDSVVIQPELLALMGISYASAVGTSIVQANKSGVPTPPAALDAAQKNLNDDDGSSTAAQGVLYKNKDVSDARISDMFEGDELADAHMIDLAKVQMFFFTIVSAVVYIGMAKGYLLGNVAALSAAKFSIEKLIPTLPQALIALMGISHGAYLGNKAVTRTQQQPAAEAQPQPQPKPAADPMLPVAAGGQAVANDVVK